MKADDSRGQVGGRTRASSLFASGSFHIRGGSRRREDHPVLRANRRKSGASGHRQDVPERLGGKQLPHPLLVPQPGLDAKDSPLPPLDGLGEVSLPVGNPTQWLLWLLPAFVFFPCVPWLIEPFHIIFS